MKNYEEKILNQNILYSYWGGGVYSFSKNIAKKINPCLAWAMFQKV